MNDHHPFAPGGVEENDAIGFEGPADLITRALVHPQIVFRFEALGSGQRYSGLVSERLLRPTQ